jgi:hypothetical protein
MSFTEEQIYIIENIINDRIKAHDISRSLVRKELIHKLNLLIDDNDENIKKYVLAVKLRISYYTTNDELYQMIEVLRDTIKSYKLISKQIFLEKKYASLLNCEIDELKYKIDLFWNAVSDYEIKDNISKLKKLILDFQTKKSWWWIW